MFGWFKKKSKAPVVAASNGEPVIAALIVEDVAGFPVEATKAALQAGTFAGMKAMSVEADGKIVTAQIGEDVVALAVMPAPYPPGDLEGPAETSWMWPKGKSAKEAIAGAKAHVLVTAVGGKGSPIKRRWMLSQVIAAVAGAAGEEGGGKAVYWAEAGILHYPEIWAKISETIDSEEAPPLLLWVDFRGGMNANGTTSMFTQGLPSLGLMEMELIDVPMHPPELRDWAMNIVTYQLEKGPVLLDGNTIGATEDAELRIRHTKSQFGHEGTVLRMEKA